MKELFLLFGLTIISVLSHAQTYPFYGKIMDNEGNPIKGANILIKSTPIGTVSEMDGYFSLNMQNGSAVLVIMLIGYKSVEYEIDSQQIKNAFLITLIPNKRKFKKMNSSVKIDSLNTIRKKN